MKNKIWMARNEFTWLPIDFFETAEQARDEIYKEIVEYYVDEEFAEINQSILELKKSYENFEKHFNATGELESFGVENFVMAYPIVVK